MIWCPTTASNRDVLYFFIECSTNFLNKLISMRRFTWIWNWTGFDGALFSLGRKAIKPSDLPPIEPWRANNRGGKMPSFVDFMLHSSYIIYAWVGQVSECSNFWKNVLKRQLLVRFHAGNQELCRRIGISVLRKHNTCKIQVCSEGNMMQGRSSARYFFMIRSI